MLWTGWRIHSMALVWTTTALAVFAAPVVEEIIFRGFLFTAVRENLGPKRAMVISALFFAERISALVVIGGGLILTGVVLIQRQRAFVEGLPSGTGPR